MAVTAGYHLTLANTIAMHNIFPFCLPSMFVTCSMFHNINICANSSRPYTPWIDSQPRIGQRRPLFIQEMNKVANFDVALTQVLTGCYLIQSSHD